MASNFPTALDSLTNPTSADNTNSGTVPHDLQHANANDAIEALQAKVGIDGSADTASQDFQLGKLSRVWRTAYASDPAVTNSAEVKNGDFWFPTDALGVFFERVSAAWAPRNAGRGFLTPFTAPSDTGFAWVNQGSSVLTVDKGAIRIATPAVGSGANLRCRVKTAPATPYVLTAFISPEILSKNFHSAGIMFRESSSGKIHVLDIMGSSIRSTKFTSPTALSADYVLAGVRENIQWLRIADDGANRICSFSYDGLNFYQLHSIGRTDFLTANQIGFVVSSENSSTPNVDAAINLLSWAIT